MMKYKYNYTLLMNSQLPEKVMVFLNNSYWSLESIPEEERLEDITVY